MGLNTLTIMKKILISIVLLFFVSLIPCAYQTARLAADAYGLVVLATIDPDKTTFNPYSRNGSFIQPGAALWMLNHLDYPYVRCSARSKRMDLCDISFIGWVGRGLDSPDPESTKKGYELLELFISRGEPVNQPFDGMAPIHEAILYRNGRYLNMLLSAGADVKAKIHKPGKEVNGLDAIAFLEFLERKSKSDFSEIRAILTGSSDWKDGRMRPTDSVRDDANRCPSEVAHRQDALISSVARFAPPYPAVFKADITG